MVEEQGRSRLGRGLAALIGDVGEEIGAIERARGQRKVPVEFLRPNARNPRKAFAEAVRAESLIVCKEDVVCPVDHEPALLAEILRLADKYQLVTRIASHAGDGNIHLNILNQNQLRN